MATQKRADERERRRLGLPTEEEEKKPKDIFKTQTGGGLAAYLKMKIAEAKLEKELKEKRQLLVKDKERTEFRY